MRTLDEVIDWYENRKAVLTGKATRDEMEEDILYYLKAYKEMVDSFTGVVVQYKELFKMIIDEAENENAG